MDKPNISRRAFWDTDFDNLNFREFPKFVITKVFHHGKDSDIYAITKFYGKEKVIEVINERLKEIDGFPRKNQFVENEEMAYKIGLEKINDLQNENNE